MSNLVEVYRIEREKYGPFVGPQKFANIDYRLNDMLYRRFHHRNDLRVRGGSTVKFNTWDAPSSFIFGCRSEAALVRFFTKKIIRQCQKSGYQVKVYLVGANFVRYGTHGELAFFPLESVASVREVVL